MKKIIFAKSETEYPYSIVLQPTERRGFMRGIRDFFCVSQGPFMGPCPNAKYPNFSQFDQKNSQSESKL